MTNLVRLTIDTPVGPMLALASDAALFALEFAGSDAASRSEKTLPVRRRRWLGPCQISDGINPVLERTRQWLDGYFQRVAPDAALLPLDMRGAPFERRVWAALRGIEPGTTATYGDIARRVGSPGAARAVGMANGANPIAIIVPCHRVIGANGALTGYGGGLDRKAWLLDHERRWRAEPRRPLLN